MRRLFIPVILVVFTACKSNTQIYSGDFAGLSQNADAMKDWDIVLNGYLAKSETVPDTMGAPVILYETQEALSVKADINEGILISVGDRDASACFGKRVKLTGKILSHDRGRVFLKASQITIPPEALATDGGSDNTSSRASNYVSCFG